MLGKKKKKQQTKTKIFSEMQRNHEDIKEN